MQIIDTIKRKVRTLVHTERILTKKIEGSFIYPLLPDKVAINLVFYNVFGRRVNWKNPKSFNEKLQWLKLYNRNPLYSKLVDKYEVKKWVAEKIGDQYIIPTYGVWNSFDEIDFSKLPDQFVMKTTHGGGNTGVVICKDKNKFDVEGARVKLTKSLHTNTYIIGREWPYKDVPHRIIAEKYIDPSPDVMDLPDYKWYCFNGEPTYCQVIQDRNSMETIDFFDTKWIHQDFVGMDAKANNAAVLPSKPENMDLQIRIARELSKQFVFSRVDLYSIGNSVFFGEITFYPASGFGRFRPDQYNEILGEMINLPGEKWGG